MFFQVEYLFFGNLSGDVKYINAMDTCTGYTSGSKGQRPKINSGLNLISSYIRLG